MIGIVVVWTLMSLCKRKSMQIYCSLFQENIHKSAFAKLEEYGRTQKLTINCLLHNVYLISWTDFFSHEKMTLFSVIVHSVDKKIHPSIVPLIPAISTTPVQYKNHSAQYR